MIELISHNKNKKKEWQKYGIVVYVVLILKVINKKEEYRKFKARIRNKQIQNLAVT